MRSVYISHDRVFTTPRGKSLAKQSFKDECNINHLMAKYEKTGLLDHLSKYEGQYGEFLGQADYHTAMNGIIAAREAFESIPAAIRAKFHNDPAEFLEFAQNPDNEQKLVDMGLANPAKPLPVAEPPSDTEPTPDPSPPAPQAV